MKKILQLFKCILITILLHSHGYCDWNQDFDSNTQQLTEQLPQFTNQEYQELYREFTQIRKKLLKKTKIEKQIKNWPVTEKLMIQDDDLGIMIKVRRANRFKDLYPWELSYLTGVTDYMVPSFPVYIGDKIAIIQKLEDFYFGSNQIGFDPKISKKVSLKTYWKALLQSYLFGVGDLVPANIGVNKRGIIRFFDTESCLNFNNTPRKTTISEGVNGVQVGYLCHAIDWDQYIQPLDAATADTVRNYVNSFINSYEENFAIYRLFRPLELDDAGLAERIAFLKCYPFEEGTTFRDFFFALYPKMSPGLDELNQIIGKILDLKVGHAASLFFMRRKIKRFELTSKQNRKIQAWIAEYVE